MPELHAIPGGHASPAFAAPELHGTPHALPNMSTKGHAHGVGGVTFSAATGTQIPALNFHAEAAHHSSAAQVPGEHVF